MPAKDLKELIAWLKANSDKVSVGTSASAARAMCSARSSRTPSARSFHFIPYRSAGLSSRIWSPARSTWCIDTPSTSGAEVRAGQIKGYALPPGRSPVAPDVPTVDEAGVPGFYFSFWHAIWAPKGTPKDIIAKLNSAVVKALADPATHKRLAGSGRSLPRQQRSPEALANTTRPRSRSGGR